MRVLATILQLSLIFSVKCLFNSINLKQETPPITNASSPVSMGLSFFSIITMTRMLTNIIKLTYRTP